MSENQRKKFRKTVIWLGSFVFLLGIVAAAIALSTKRASAKEVAKQLDLGERYLSELNYEQAIVAYQNAIAIDPKCVEAYIGLADVYIAMGEYEKAESVLKDAKEILGIDEEAINRKILEIEKAIEKADKEKEQTDENSKFVDEAVTEPVSEDMESQYPSYEEENAVEATIPLQNYDNIVTDAYNEEFGGMHFEIPKINLDSISVQEVNSEIWDIFYDEVELARSNWEEYGAEGVSNISYNWTVNDKMISIRIKGEFAYGDIEAYYVYNISLADEKLLSKEEFLDYCDITQKQFEAMASQALYLSFMSLVQNPYDISNNQEINMALEKTISNENIANVKPFLNENNELCIIGRIYWIAGPEFKLSILNIENYRSSPEIIEMPNLKPTEEMAVIPTENPLEIEDYVMDWKDDNLEAAMRRITGIYGRDIMLSDVIDLTHLDLNSKQISDINALKDLTNLTYLDLYNNQISDISALKNLANLGYLFFGQQSY